jgi:hypothetical protein
LLAYKHNPASQPMQLLEVALTMPRAREAAARGQVTNGGGGVQAPGFKQQKRQQALAGHAGEPDHAPVCVRRNGEGTKVKRQDRVARERQESRGRKTPAY